MTDRELMQQALDALETVYKIIIDWDECGGKRSRRELARRIVDLYTASPQRPWVGLTMADMAELRQGGWHNISDERFRVIEAKIKEKNA